MIVVKVELWPHGDRGRAREISRVDISNVGGDDELGDYAVRTADDRWRPRHGSLRRHPRSEHVLNLVAKALRVLGYDDEGGEI